MCFFGRSAPQDNSANIAAQAEADRQARVKEGRAAVDAKFAPYDDSYFDTYKDKYLDYYTPQIDDQSSAARKQLILRLATTGNLTSSYGADQLAEFSKMDRARRDQLTNDAYSAASDLRSKTENARGDLYNLASTAADPSTAAAAAATRVASLEAPQTFSPLGNVFADAANLAASAVAAERRGYTGTGTGLFRPSRSAGSSYVVA